MKILITGGHFSPAVAVIEALPKDFGILYVGRKHGLEGDAATSLEYQEITKRGIPFVSLTAGRLQRRISIHTLWSLLKIPIGIVQAFFIVQKCRPDVVVVFGGYIALPVSLATWVFGIPIVVHEQTLGAGLANRIIGLFAHTICISWESSFRFFKRSKTILTGNPTRNYQLSTIPSARAQGEGNYQLSNENIQLIYITGGSSGSHAINVLVEGCIERLLHNFRVFHQTGDAKKYNDFERLNKLRSTLPDHLQRRYMIVKFINPEDVYGYIKESALVVSRSGINTVTELFLLKKPALLIPLPFAQDNEQQRNAEFFVRFGFGKVHRQESLTSDMLLAAITQMLKTEKRYLEAFSKASIPIQSDASKRVSRVIQSVAANTSSNP